MIEPIKKSAYDIVVVGGGIAGIAASVAAAREGKRVLLIEKQVNLGGLATTGLISWYEPLCNGKGKQVISGIAEELIRLAVKVGFDNLHKKWGGEGYNPPRYERFATYYSPTFFSLALDSFVRENGVELTFDTRATYPVMEGDICRGVIVENADGRCFYPAKIVIDCSGDACIFQRGGAPCQDVENFFSYIVHETDFENTKNYVQTKDLTKLRRWKNCGSDCEGVGQPKNIKKLKGVTAQDINDYLAIGKERMLKKYANSNRNEREILTLPTMPQLRVIRNIVGEYVFTGENGETHFDNIGRVGDFRYEDKEYEVPYRCLYNKNFPNMLAAGRIVSAVGNGMEVLRVIPCCAVTGQAAGQAASLAIDSQKGVGDIDVTLLQATLKSKGVLF